MLPDLKINQTIDTTRKSFFKTSVFVVLILVVVGLCALGYYLVNKIRSDRPETLSQNQDFKPKSLKLVLDRAPVGEIIEGFPPELILSEDAVIIDSVEQDANVKNGQILITRFVTKANPTILSGQYKDYFANKKWVIMSEQADEKQFTISVFAANIKSLINIGATRGAILGDFLVTVIVNKR